MAARNFEGTVRDVFRRTPDLRAHEALKNFAEYASSGDVVGAITGLVGRVTAFGLAGGAAVGVVATGLGKLVEGAQEFSRWMTESDNVLAKMPAAGASLELLEKSLANINAQQEKAAGFWQKAGSFVVRKQVGDVAVRGDIAAQQEQIELSDRYAKALDQMVEKGQKAAQVELLKAAGFDTAAKAMEAQIATAEKLADIENRAKEMREEVEKKKLKGPQQSQELAAIDAWESHQREITKTSAEREASLKPAAALVEKAKLSSKELGEGEGSLTDRLYLRQAADAEQRGERFRKAGFVALAAQQFAEADRWKSQATGLKESEKGTMAYDVKTGIDSSDKFNQLLAGIAAVVDGVRGITMVNQ